MVDRSTFEASQNKTEQTTDRECIKRSDEEHGTSRFRQTAGGRGGRTEERTTTATETCGHTDGHDRRTGRRRTYATDRHTACVFCGCGCGGGPGGGGVTGAVVGVGGGGAWQVATRIDPHRLCGTASTTAGAITTTVAAAATPSTPQPTLLMDHDDGLRRNTRRVHHWSDGSPSTMVTQ
ncbi:hypothetical protein ACI65C_009399 [Semiaphis heraclei]